MKTVVVKETIETQDRPTLHIEKMYGIGKSEIYKNWMDKNRSKQK